MSVYSGTIHAESSSCTQNMKEAVHVWFVYDLICYQCENYVQNIQEINGFVSHQEYVQPAELSTWSTNPHKQ